MIKFSDGAVLALTKLRTRPVRTIITILLASLLFGILVAASLIMTGALASVDSFRKDGLTSRYIVEVSKPIDTNILSATNKDPILIAKAKKQYEQLVEAKIAEAKRLGVSYSQASERPPYSLSNDGKPRSLIPGDTNGIAQALLAEKFGTMPSIDRAQLQSIAGRYDVLGIINSHYHHVPRGASLKQMRDGVEVFYDESNQDESRKYYVREHIDGNMMIIAPPQITSPYMLPGNGNWKPDGT
ncbi:MAG: hypothetical protein ABIR91_00355, partial [Candidatus Saccharimonadales bacterium]